MSSSITSAFASSSSAPSIKLSDLEKLKGSSNYKYWSTIVGQYLKVTQTWSIVNGTLVQPDATTDANGHAQWAQADAAAKLILFQMVDSSLLHLIEDDSLSSAQSWAKLKSNYAATSTLSTFIKFQEYFSTAIDGTKPLADELEKRGRLWQEVDGSGILASKDLLKIFGLLAAVPDSYKHIINPILAVTEPANLK